MSVRRCTPRMARKPHRCDNCGRLMPKGTRYVEHVASPGWDGIVGPHWYRLRTHGENTTDCP